MDQFDADVLRDAAQEERMVEEIHAAALQKARLLHPEIEYVVDPRTIDDYCYKEWGYPGAWYSMGFRLPDGFRTKEELIDAIAADTVRHFEQYGKPKSGR